MNFINKLIGTKAADLSATNGVEPAGQIQPSGFGGFSLGSIIPKLFAGQKVNYTTAMQHADVYACVKILAESFGQIPNKVYHTTGYGALKKVRRMDHGREFDIFSRCPNDYMTWQEMYEMYMATIALTGNFYAEIKRNTKGEVYALLPLKYQRGVSVWYDNNGLPMYCYTSNSGKGIQHRQYYSSRELLHIKSFSLDGLTGLSTISQGAHEIGLAIAQTDSASSLFENGAQPNGVLETSNIFEDRNLVQQIRSRWQEEHGGTQNKGKIAILENGMSYKSIQMTSTDAQLLETMQLSRERISAMFRVPLHMLNSKDGMKYTTVENNNIAFFRDALYPHVVKWENALNLLCRKGYTIKMDEKQFVRGDYKTIVECVAKEISVGLCDMNEGRVDVGRDPIDGYDGVFAIDTNNITLGTIEDLHHMRKLNIQKLELEVKQMGTQSEQSAGGDNDKAAKV